MNGLVGSGPVGNGPAERIAARAVARACDRLAAGIGALLPGAEVAREGGTVVVTGRGVRRALRWVAGVLR